MPGEVPESARPALFDARRQCCWCGSDNTAGAAGYAGERGCPTCGWGGEGEPDVPCMFYRISRSLEAPGRANRRGEILHCQQ